MTRTFQKKLIPNGSWLAGAAWLAVAAAWPVRADAAPDKEEKTRRYTHAEETILRAKENLPKQVSTENPELTKLVTSARLGKASISGCVFENPDGSLIMIGADYFGKPRNADNPTPGPFEAPGTGTLTMKVWPLASTRETK